MVYANLKSPAHPVGMQQRFEKQSCANFLDFAGVGRVQIRKFVRPAQTDEKSHL